MTIILHNPCPYSSYDLAVCFSHKTIICRTAAKTIIIKPQFRAFHDISHRRFRTFRNENGREPNETELIDLLKSEYGVKIKNVSDLYGAMVTSISEARDDDDDYHMSDDALFNEKTASMNEYEEQVEVEGLSDTMKVAMQALNDKERKVISMAYGIGFNRSYKDYEIGEEMGYTSERIRQIRKKAESKIKNAYTAVATR